MKKSYLFLCICCLFSCRLVYYVMPVEDYIKNTLSTDILVTAFRKNGKKDSIPIKANQTSLLISEMEGAGQSQLYLFDSIKVSFFDKKAKTDIYCSIYFNKKDTLSGELCLKDKISLFSIDRQTRSYNEKTKESVYTHIVDSLDYKEAK